MEFDDAKENIQPLASGRNVSILQASITHSASELHEQRCELEALIHNYNGDDPLHEWCNYICWIEQSYPSGGKESGLNQVLSKCLARFSSEERYYQDRRLIKLFIKFLEGHKEPLECYQQLCSAGIGTMVADFYIAWAYCYDSIGQMRKADEIFRRGIQCRAQPLEDLKEAQQHFGFSVAQRTLYKDDSDALEDTNRQIEERRLALSSLRGYRNRKGDVGSVRTGAAVKSFNPGTVQSNTNLPSTSTQNARVTVLKDENVNPNALESESVTTNEDILQTAEVKSSAVVCSIIDKVRHQENEREPGPWNKINDKKNAKKLLRQKQLTHELNFNIHEDKDNESDNEENLINAETIAIKPFIYPANFVSKNSPQQEWILPIITECEPEQRTLPCYNKSFIYPRPNREFQTEELIAYLRFKKYGITNEFTRRLDPVWSTHDVLAPVRLYPNFGRQSKPQELDKLDTFEALPKIDGMIVPVDKIYDQKNEEEFQIEELMALRLLNTQNQTVLDIEDMDETACATSNNAEIQRRKSLFPRRQSMVIRSLISSNCLKSETQQASMESNLKKNQAYEKSDVKNKKDETLTPNVEEPSNDFQFKAPALPTTESAHNVDLPPIQNPLSPLVKLPFEIFVEEKENEFLTVTQQSSTENMNNDNDFNFKTPALPSTPAIQSKEIPPAQEPVSSLPKLPFEIFVEERENKVSTVAVSSNMIETEGNNQKDNDFNFKMPVSASQQPLSSLAKLPFEIFVEERENEVLTVAEASNMIETEGNNKKDNDFNFKMPVSATQQPLSSLPKLPFEIFVEERENEVLTVAEASNMIETEGNNKKDNDFNFKIPSSAAQQPLNSLAKLPFEIFVEENENHVSPVSQARTAFDAEETCSTQMFNNYLKTQLASTPKMEQKTLKRQFNVLRDVETPKTTCNSEPNDQSPTENKLEIPLTIAPNTDLQSPQETTPEDEVATTVTYSPIRKQLSTIFETSEHGTHSTAASTKSTIGSQESDVLDTQVPNTVNSNMTALKDVVERIEKIELEEHSTKPQNKLCNKPSGNLFAVFEDSIEHADKSIRSEVRGETTRYEAKLNQEQVSMMRNFESENDKHEKTAFSELEAQKSPMNTDFSETIPDVMLCKPSTVSAEIGNFDRLVQRETTNCGEDANAFQPIVRFQEDKTETISKIVYPRNFPEDKTETITKISDSIFAVSRNEVQSVKKVLPNTSLSFLNAKPKNDISVQPEKPIEDLDDSFEFFRKTPVKSAPSPWKMPSDKKNLKNYLTPLFAPDQKRVCSQETPHHFEEKNKAKQQLFPFSVEKKQLPSKKMDEILSKSFLLDFSYIDEPEQHKQENATNENSKFNLQNNDVANGIKLRNSLLPDFSLLEEIPSSQVPEKVNSIRNLQNSLFRNGSVFEKSQLGQSMRDKSLVQEIPRSSTKFEPISGLPDFSQIFEQSIKEKQCDGSKFSNNRKSQIPQFVGNFPETSIEREVQRKTGAIPKYSVSSRKSIFPTNKSNNAVESENQKESNTNSNGACKANNVSTIFELNAETEAFSAGLDLNKNSTMLRTAPITLENSYQQNLNPASNINQMNNNNVRCPKLSVLRKSQDTKEVDKNDNNHDDNNMSIYFKNPQRTPILASQNDSWTDEEAHNKSKNSFTYHEVDMNETNQIIQSMCVDNDVNPFSVDLVNAFLNQIDVISYIKSLPNTELVGNIPRLHTNALLKVNNVQFKIKKVIGQGAYGTIYYGVDTKSNKKYVFKQERPPNYWEYYICLEVQSRITNEEILSSYMKIDYAKFGNNAGILTSQFSPFGSIISVCNKINEVTFKCVDEYVVMYLTCELLEIIDHLHAAGIIHADIKADNFLLMKKLSYNGGQLSLQLIDFGVSIDMRQFKPGQEFTYVHNDIAFKCVEMREQRPWSYQLDLYGLAGVIHVLLFGKFMEIEKPANKLIWMPKTRMPRYINKTLWETIFRTLLNIRDHRSMPNLQELRSMVKEEMAEKERYVISKIAEFNKALDA